ncbi:hypothetical protein [Nocardia sp. Marseille-Q1738]
MPSQSLAARTALPPTVPSEGTMLFRRSREADLDLLRVRRRLRGDGPCRAWRVCGTAGGMIFAACCCAAAISALTCLVALVMVVCAASRSAGPLNRVSATEAIAWARVWKSAI